MKTKFYSFLDVVIDVFYSIILYNVFIAFPGFTIESMLMVLTTFIMINYRRGTRNYNEIPKYYLFDVYLITIIMFIFSQWPNYFNNITYFIYILAIFFAIDAIYALLSIFIHKEKRDEPSLKFYFIAELVLALIYF